MINRRSALIAVAVVALAGAGVAVGSEVGISLTKDGPQPATVTVNWGDTVLFKNDDTVGRVVASQRAGFTSPTLAPGDTFGYHFNGKVGRYSFVQGGPRPTFQGAVAVGLQGEVTLATKPEVVPFGASVVISGQSPYPETPVVVKYREIGQTTSWTTILTLTAGADGSYSGQFRPVTGGRVQTLVAAEQLKSPVGSFAVRPTVSITAKPRRAKANNRIAVIGNVRPAGVATSADLEAYRKDQRRWVRVDRRTVAKTGKVAFALKVPKGATKIRITVQRNALRPGYVATTSRWMAVFGR